MDQPTRMEECPPGGDCASGEGDPSKYDNPPASWTPNPAGDLAQGKRERSSSVSACCALSRSVTHIWSRLYSLQADTTRLSLLI